MCMLSRYDDNKRENGAIFVIFAFREIKRCLFYLSFCFLHYEEAKGHGNASHQRTMGSLTTLSTYLHELYMILMHICIHIYTCIYAFIYSDIYVCIHVLHFSIYVCMYVCISVRE